MEKDKKPFNDVIDYFDTIGGRPEKIEMKTLPVPIRIIGYFFIGCFVCIAVSILVLSLISH